MLTVGTDSYASVAEADLYHTERGAPDAWMAATLAQKEEALRYATRYIDTSFEFSGYLQDYDQALKFPRYSMYDKDGRLYEGTPIEVKEATFELARSHLNDVSLIQPTVNKAPAGIRSVTAGSVSVEFGAGSEGTAGAPADYAFVRRLLSKFVTGGVGQPTIYRS